MNESATTSGRERPDGGDQIQDITVEVEERSRLEALERALRESWLYDGFQCSVCFDCKPFGSVRRDGSDVVHEDDCIIPTLAALVPDGEHAEG